MSVICRILASNSPHSAGQNTSKAHGAIVVLELIRMGGAAEKIMIPRTLDVQLNLGDRLKSVSGTAIVLINPGTQSGAFILSPTLPPNPDWKNRTEIEINPETTKVICRPQISVGSDIGTVLRATSGTTR